MILVDANVLVYAIDSDPHQNRAERRWLEATLPVVRAICSTGRGFERFPGIERIDPL